MVAMSMVRVNTPRGSTNVDLIVVACCETEISS
jgi:hypothetical protein